LEENQAQLSIDEEADIRILGNDFYLERVFMNIIENSIKYAKESAQISIRLFVSQNIAHIHLADQGIGMDQKQIDRVFDNFYRAQSGNVHNTKGFGLGLSYAKLITEKLGGSIKMEGQLNKGCTVKLKFPLQA
jgi:two-component system phosphate regulon sensor histidine kinase PhoR